MVEQKNSGEQRHRLLGKDWHLSPTVSAGNILVLAGWIIASIWIVAEIRAETQRNTSRIESHEEKTSHDPETYGVIQFRVGRIDGKVQQIEERMKEIRDTQQRILLELRKQDRRNEK